MTILHIIQQSPQQTSSLKNCLQRIGDQDAVILIEDAVYALLYQQDAHWQSLSSDIMIFALQEDILARGLDGLTLRPHQSVNYNGFVDLSVKYDKSQTWF